MPVSHAAAGLSNTAAEGERNRVGLLEMLTQLADPRSSQGKRHKLVFVLACAVVATLAGATNYRQLASQVADLPQSLLAELGARWNWFRRRFGWPSEPTLRRVLQSIDAAELDRLVGAWLYARAWRDADGLLVIALDGKVLRGSWTEANDQVTLFSAMIHGRAVTIAQTRVPDGTNEITQVSQLLQHIAEEEDRRVLVTFDAAHTQRETAEYIAGERGFDYIMTVKGTSRSCSRKYGTGACRCWPPNLTTSSRNAVTAGSTAGRHGPPPPVSTSRTRRSSPASAATSSTSPASRSVRKSLWRSPAAPPPEPARPNCTPTYGNTGE